MFKHKRRKVTEPAVAPNADFSYSRLNRAFKTVGGMEGDSNKFGHGGNLRLNSVAGNKSLRRQVNQFAHKTVGAA